MRGYAARMAAAAFLLLAPGGAHGASQRWEIREAEHPLLGNIRFTFNATPIATPVGISRVSSQVYVSCERDTHAIAIELANAQAPGDPRGLAPLAPPKLVCKQRTPAGTTQEELPAQWAANGLGDVLARGFRPEALLACNAIAIVQQVELPKGWSQESARLVFDLAPAQAELRSVIGECGKPRLARARDAQASPWVAARTAATGKTAVRAAAAAHAGVVAHFAPNQAVLVRKSRGEWWRVKSREAGGVEGYVRKDRLILR